VLVTCLYPSRPRLNGRSKVVGVVKSHVLAAAPCISQAARDGCMKPQSTPARTALFFVSHAIHIARVSDKNWGLQSTPRGALRAQLAVTGIEKEKMPGGWTKFNQISTLPWTCYLRSLERVAPSGWLDGTQIAPAIITTLNSKLAVVREA
jgi:hypothetical protein